MGQYFYVMSEMRRLEKSDVALKKQAQQASKALLAKMDEVTKLEKTNKKLEELSFKKVAIQSGAAGGDNEDKTTQLLEQVSLLKQKNKELKRSLEDKDKELSLIRNREKSESRRLQQQQETLRKEL